MADTSKIFLSQFSLKFVTEAHLTISQRMLPPSPSQSIKCSSYTTSHNELSVQGTLVNDFLSLLQFVIPRSVHTEALQLLQQNHVL